MFQFSYWLTAFPVFGKINRSLSKRLMPTGKTILGATILFAAGSFHLDTPVYLLCGSAFTLLAVAYGAVQLLQPKLKLHLDVPRVTVAGRPFDLGIRAENHGRHPAKQINIRLAPEIRNHELIREQQGAHISHIGPRKLAVSSLQLEPSRRGFAKLPNLEVSSSFPLNLCCKTATHPVSRKLLVAPKLVKLNNFEPIALSLSALLGDQGINFPDGAAEFVGSREYIPGLSIKRLDYRAWARLGHPHVCQFEKECNAGITLVLDLSRCRDEEVCESAIELTHSIADSLDQYGLRIHCILVGGNAPEFIDASTSQLEQTSVILAKISLYSALSNTPVPPRKRELGPAIAILPVDEDRLEELPEPGSNIAQQIFVSRSNRSGIAQGIHVPSSQIERGDVRFQ